ncbi:amidohydrolase [Solitalea lacus]|uniref:amidohydrolase n=1 Tax=Solitalea lacus TaxID=2911172 RepID=UPI001EDA9B96|nr:amidohydrolase [Solitalea lacus]UKJ06009.1 amidohydrolase [Solitalea lacus]
MKSNITITIIQTALYWENIDANLSMLGQKMLALKEKTDLIILPEMFSTGFTMNASMLAEQAKGKTVRWLAEMAGHMNAVITGSIIVEEQNKFYNRLVWMRPDGSFETYDKRHLFGLGKEDDTYAAGDKKLLVDLKGWNICPMICYDLRFPVWARNKKDNPYDLYLIVANWPERRSLHWKTLLPARAIENQSYVVGVNRVGNDGNEIYHSGNSMIIAPDGVVLYHKEHDEDMFTLELSGETLEFVRRAFPFLKDQDDFNIKRV